MKISLCIPTYNGGEKLKYAIKGINTQRNISINRFIIDSCSKDDTIAFAIVNNFIVNSITPSDFDHGGTRQQLVDTCKDADFVIFLTQDAIPASPETFESIIAAFSDPKIGMAYGRQLPHKNAKVLETHARLFNYPEISAIKNADSIKERGFKTIFCSNSFSAYRTSALYDVGGFPSGNIMGEDTIVAAKMILNGWSLAYVAEATVYHSHSYTIKQEFNRYFDTGVFHAQNKWLFQHFGKPSGEGFRYVFSEIKYAASHSAFLIIPVCFSTLAKWLGYKLGLNYTLFSKSINKKLSLHKHYWDAGI